jgi:transcriptional regulator with XRE-family HTH domain
MFTREELKLVFPGIIKRIREEEQGLGQEEFAYRLGISTRSYQDIEAGRTLPSVITLLNLSNEFDISMDSLFTDIQSELKNLIKNANEKE